MIRTALPADWEEIQEIYSIARAFMIRAGNPTQWADFYPPQDQTREDIRLGNCYLCIRDDRIQGVFAMIPGEDPFYRVIEGEWLNEAPYWAVHRVASRGEVPGIATEILTWAMDRCGNVRIDTHPDNLPMQRVLAKNGFTHCGRFLFEDGTPRLAYQKTRE